MGYEGEVVLNYRLTKKLGEGGFGAVYLAEHIDLGRLAAVKILHPQYAREPSVVERFFREARAVCAIGHRAIVQIENFGALSAGEPFYLMEYFAGRSLHAECKLRALDGAQLVAIFDPVADALGAAHARNIIHRDLKPDNIMVRFEGDRVVDVRLLDFGVAKLMDIGDAAGSITGGAMGTPNFMAPEQAIDAKNVDVRADVYAFGATVYAAIAGRPPFVAASVPAIMVMVQMDPPVPLRELVPEAPFAVEAALARCLAKSRDYRPPTIAAAWRELRGALLAEPMVRAPLPTQPPREDLSGVAATEASYSTNAAATSNQRPRGKGDPTRAGYLAPVTPAELSPPPQTRGAPTAMPPVIAASEPPRRRSKLPLVLLAVAVAAGGVGVVLALRGGGETPQVARASADAAPIAGDVAVAPADAAVADAPADAAVADAAPDAPVDAAPVRSLPSDAPARRSVPVDAGAPPVDAAPVKPPPSGCSEGSFLAVANAAAPSGNDIRAALGRLRACTFDAATAQRLQQALVAACTRSPDC